MNKPLPNRQSIRLKNYDYSQAGYYFITICIQNRVHLFGEIIDGKIVLNTPGTMVQTIWNRIPQYYSGIAIDAFQIMPNHIHGIITVGADSISARDPDFKSARESDSENKRAEMDSAPTVSSPTLGDIVQMFKRYTTVEYINMVKNGIVQPFNKRIWQRNYWEHIVRNENELNGIREYIKNNPVNWFNDKLNGGIGNMVLESVAPYGEEIWMV